MQTKTKLIQRLAGKMKTFFTKTLTEEIGPILRAYKTNQKKAEEKNLRQSDLTQRNAK